jgi:biotin operon repressor
LIQRFWDFNKTAKISPTEISLYFYLLKIGYENERYDFKISDVELGKELGLTRKTIKSTKEKLKNLGLIQFQSKNGLPSHYRLLLNYSFEIEPETSIKNEENTIVEKNQNREILEIFESILSAQNSVEVVKEVEINSDIKASSETTEKQKHEWKQAQKQEQEQLNLKNNKIPSLDEFIEYAKSLGVYEPELELSISEKYESWKNNGWKNTSNRPISNWKSTLKSTLPYLINKSEKNSLSLQDIPNIKRPES